MPKKGANMKKIRDESQNQAADACLFCRIIKGEVPALIVYEDDMLCAIADVSPVTIGHTLIISKQHYADIFGMPEVPLRQVMVVAQKLAMLYKRGLNAQAVNILSASGKAAHQSVFHFHVHLIPRYEDDGVDLDFHGNPRLREKSQKALEKLKGML
jgi:histidine triad (HIT) family protein